VALEGDSAFMKKSGQSWRVSENRLVLFVEEGQCADQQAETQKRRKKNGQGNSQQRTFPRPKTTVVTKHASEKQWVAKLKQ
jgi:hypothetical protein